MLHHFFHAAFALLVGDVDEIDACGVVAKVESDTFTIGLSDVNRPPEGVMDFYEAEVRACDGEGAVGGVRMDGGESCGFIFINSIGPVEVGLADLERIIRLGAKVHAMDVQLYLSGKTVK